MSTTVYQQGNISIADGRLRIERQSLPLANIQSITTMHVHKGKRHLTLIMVIAALAVWTGVRHAGSGWGLAAMGAGVLIGVWCWVFHRQSVWIVRLNLLLNQRIKLLFLERRDADELVKALTAAMGGRLVVLKTK